MALISLDMMQKNSIRFALTPDAAAGEGRQAVSNLLSAVLRNVVLKVERTQAPLCRLRLLFVVVALCIEFRAGFRL